MVALKGIEPKAVFGFFEEICKIPHGSGNTKNISDYCVAFAKSRGLFYRQDGYNNVIIKKPATVGYELAPPVIIQGHLDMVCTKNDGCDIDFLNDGLKLAVLDEYISADGTTLGGDDGIAVAFVLALLDSDEIRHPEIEVLLTADEEIGMLGAAAADLSELRGRLLLNIDSEDEGVFTVSCAGGVRAVCKLPVTSESAAGEKIDIVISGLAGGHSGVEIDKIRANSNCLSARLLYRIASVCDIRIISAAGGEKDNAIPYRTMISLLCDDSKKALGEIEKFEGEIRNEYKRSDGNITVRAELSGVSEETALTAESTEKTVFMLLNLPNGIQKMSADIEGLAETSLNMGVLLINADSVTASFAVRSSVKSAEKALTDRLCSIMDFLGGELSLEGEYPPWEYKPDSMLRETAINSYRKLFGKEPKIEAIHAGLECGVFCGKLEGLDCLSFGPDILDAHTAKERMYIPSVERTWRLLLEILENIK